MVKKFTFKNGLRLLLVPQPQSPSTTVLVLVEAGSEYETRNNNGISHFLEHMVFKGTTNRPKPGMIACELESIGAQTNAFTGYEYTGYWAKAQASKTAKILEIVSDMYLNPIFDAAEIDKERGVIIEEINHYEDMPTRRIQELFTFLLYGDQPAGWDIAGRKEVIRRIKREDFLKYRNSHYVPGKTIVIVSGKFREEQVKGYVKELFGKLKPKKIIRKAKVKEKQSKPAVLLKYKKSDQTHLVLGVRAFGIFDKRRYAIQVLGDILGGGMSSRLFHRIREELGAAYYVRAGVDFSTDHGYFEVSAGADHAKVKAVIAAALQEFERISKELVPEDEFQKSKDHLSGNLLLSLESSDELANFYGSQELMTRKFDSPEEIIKRIQKVTREEVRAVARSIFREDKLNLAMIGPYADAAPFRRLLALSL